jgi:hypothetical protein
MMLFALVVYGLDDCAFGTLVQIVELAHVLLADLKVVDICVFLDSAGGVALGERDLREYVSVFCVHRKAVETML